MQKAQRANFAERHLCLKLLKGRKSSIQLRFKKASFAECEQPKGLALWRSMKERNCSASIREIKGELKPLKFRGGKIKK